MGREAAQKAKALGKSQEAQAQEAAKAAVVFAKEQQFTPLEQQEVAGKAAAEAVAAAGGDMKQQAAAAGLATAVVASEEGKVWSSRQARLARLLQTQPNGLGPLWLSKPQLREKLPQPEFVQKMLSDPSLWPPEIAKHFETLCLFVLSLFP